MLTLQLLRDGVEPVQVDAVLAADAGGAAPEGMQWDGPDDKRQFKEQLGRPRNIHTNLPRQGRAEKLSLVVFSQSGGAGISPELGRRGSLQSSLTFREYSTWMMRHWRMDGPTGGIFSARPCHTSLFPAGMGSPVMLVTTDFFCFLVPRAMKVWVWMMAALGTTARLVQLSISAKMGMTSPAKTNTHMLEEGRKSPVLVQGIAALAHQGLALLSDRAGTWVHKGGASQGCCPH